MANVESQRKRFTSSSVRQIRKRKMMRKGKQEHKQTKKMMLMDLQLAKVAKNQKIGIVVSGEISSLVGQKTNLATSLSCRATLPNEVGPFDLDASTILDHLQQRRLEVLFDAENFWYKMLSGK